MNQQELFKEEVKNYEGENGYICIVCDIRQPADQFYHMPSGEVKRKCRSCKASQDKQIKYLKTIHEYPDEDYACPICERTMHDFKRRNQIRFTTWILDHDHDTGDFRGWLCHHCNVGLGALADSITRVKRAVKYLEDHNDR